MSRAPSTVHDDGRLENGPGQSLASYVEQSEQLLKSVYALRSWAEDASAWELGRILHAYPQVIRAIAC